MFPPANHPTPTFPYRIEAEVGAGSMGVVYRAVELALDRRVAIKVLRPSMLDEEPLAIQRELRARFLQEARAQAALAHPSVTTVHSVGEEAGYPYMVMEWLDGDTLATLMKAREKLPSDRAVGYGVELLDALAAAHRAGVVHRDIKPSNLLIQRHDGRLKVMDFGIALVRRADDPVQTHAGVVLATPRFASPEQLGGIDVDGRSDLFSTGVLLYYLLTGIAPFRGKGFLEQVDAVLHHEPEPLRDLEPSVPKAVEAVVLRALAKERGDRFDDADAMAAPLRAHLAERARSKRRRAADGTQTDSEGDHDSEDEATLWRMPSRRGLPTDPHLMIVRLVEAWPSRALSRQTTLGLIGRLLERPVHASPFAGAVLIGPVCLLLYDGVLLGAVDVTTGATGDAVAEALPDRSAAQLHPVPSSLPARVVPLLATVLHPPRVLHGALDSSFVNLPALAEKLRVERFDGLFRLRHGKAVGLAFFDRGSVVLNLYSEGWDGVPLDESWQRWISDIAVHADVEAKQERPPALWFRHVFREWAFEVALQEGDAPIKPPDSGPLSGSSLIRQLAQTPRPGARRARLAMRLLREEAPPRTHDLAGHEGDPAFRFLTFLLDELPAFLAERKLSGDWKYLAEWLWLVRRATLHHALERPKGRQTDTFDLVTTTKEGKALHVAQWMPTCTGDALRHQVARVIAAKRARNRTGDIGGAFVVSPRFEDSAIEAYRESVAESGVSGWFGMDASFTGYQGFVRMGARRGFHLMLVEETPDGFVPMLISD